MLNVVSMLLKKYAFLRGIRLIWKYVRSVLFYWFLMGVLILTYCIFKILLLECILIGPSWPRGKNGKTYSEPVTKENSG